jgi:hypothetical protein
MRRFGELEAVIMDRLWQWGRPVLVREVVEDLRGERPLAYTTVMTVMENLHRKGWLRLLGARREDRTGDQDSDREGKRADRSRRQESLRDSALAASLRWPTTEVWF